MKPGYHQYHLHRLLLQAHKRKAYVLLGLTSFLLIATIVFGCCFVRTHCTNDQQLRTSHNQLYVHLSEHDEQSKCYTNFVQYITYSSTAIYRRP